MRLCCTGSREWSDPQTVVEELEWERQMSRLFLSSSAFFVDVGDARGADAAVRKACQDLGIPFEVHYADWEGEGKIAGFKRNWRMLDLKPDLVLAFWDGASKGTLHTIQSAVERGIPVRIVPLAKP